MNIFTDISKFGKNTPISVTIGNFDGVHKGHEAIIKSACNHAGQSPTVITFDPHPRKVLSPGFAPMLITNTNEKLTFLEKMGIENVFVVSFAQVKDIEPFDFLSFINSSLDIRSITVGFNFYFGKKQEGTPEMLFWWSQATNISVSIVQPVIMEGIRISSTEVRGLILQGEMEKAAAFLSYPFVISGNVIKGRMIGKSIGFPTINLETPDKVLPPDGVYITAAVINGETVPSITNIGFSPTIDEESGKRRIETFVLNKKLPELYGKPVSVYFLKKLRDEIKFSSREKLSAKIGQDTDIALAYWSEKGSPDLPDIRI